VSAVRDAVEGVIRQQHASGKPLAVIVAGHNGSGKSTMWDQHLSDRLQLPLFNADRVLRSMLPEVADLTKLPLWARKLRDNDRVWMQVAQSAVTGFVSNASKFKLPFAYETVFSHWRERDDGSVETKVELIRQIQASGYFVMLIFVGLANVSLSVVRVDSRRVMGGHTVDFDKLQDRFPRTQRAIRLATGVADASVLVDNSSDLEDAFTVCRVQHLQQIDFDIRDQTTADPRIVQWMSAVC